MNYTTAQAFEEREQELLRQHGITKHDGEYHVPSSDGRRTYIVTFAGHPYGEDNTYLWNCTCPARTTCKHINRVAAISGQLSDEFGYE